MLKISKLFALCYVLTLSFLAIELWRIKALLPSSRNEASPNLALKETDASTETPTPHHGQVLDEVNVNCSTMLSVLVKVGSPTYYTLDHVKNQLVHEVQQANNALQVAISKHLSPVSPETENITRAILAYLPHNMDGYMRQVKSLYLSLAFMRLSQPKNIKTDLIVFTSKDGIDYPMSFGCVREARTTFEDSERCTVVEHIPMSSRPAMKDKAMDPLQSYAAYIDSILIVAEFPFTSVYDFILRADLDTYLTPGFGDWVLPRRASIAIGLGGYGSLNTNAHLAWVGVNRLGLKDIGLTNLGATWYGGSEVTVETAKTTVEIMPWLHTQEFNAFELCCSGTNSWPHWHWPVIMLYGMHIAVNQMQTENVLLSKSGIAEMDFYSTSVVPLVKSIKQIHCWHGDSLFSKFAFLEGKYRNLVLTKYINMTTPRDYATVISVSSDRLSADELQTYISSPSLMKKNKWMRP